MLRRRVGMSVIEGRCGVQSRVACRLSHRRELGMDGFARILLLILSVAGLTGIGSSAQTFDPLVTAPKFRLVRVEVQVMAEGKPVSDLPLLVICNAPVTVGMTGPDGRWSQTVRVPEDATAVHVAPTARGLSLDWAAPKNREKVDATRELIRTHTFQGRYVAAIDRGTGRVGFDIDVQPAVTVSFALESADGQRVVEGLPLAVGMNQESVVAVAAADGTPFRIGSLVPGKRKDVFVLAPGGRVWVVEVPACEKDTDLGVIHEPQAETRAEVHPVVENIELGKVPRKTVECHKFEKASTLVSLDGKSVFVVGRGMMLGPCVPSVDRLAAAALTVRVPVGRYYALGGSFRALEWQANLIALARAGENLQTRGVPVVEIKPDVVNTLEFTMDAAEKAMGK